MKKVKQSIPNKTKVIFDLMGSSNDEWGEEYQNIDLELLHNKKASILQLDTYAELGDKDHEYYSIVFENGIILEAVSGYHLTPIN